MSLNPIYYSGLIDILGGAGPHWRHGRGTGHPHHGGHNSSHRGGGVRGGGRGGYNNPYNNRQGGGYNEQYSSGEWGGLIWLTIWFNLLTFIYPKYCGFY